jgi:hypothetical protein
MRKILTALVAAATISATAITTSSDANAWWGWWFPGAVAAGVVTGAVVGSALAPRPYYPYVLALRPVRLLRTSLPHGLERLQLGTCLLSYELGGGRIRAVADRVIVGT